jgi:hypothetical protein
MILYTKLRANQRSDARERPAFGLEAIYIGTLAEHVEELLPLALGEARSTPRVGLACKALEPTALEPPAPVVHRGLAHSQVPSNLCL